MSDLRKLVVYELVVWLTTGITFTGSLLGWWGYSLWSNVLIMLIAFIVYIVWDAHDSTGDTDGTS